jgi:L-proline amide hydrolase
MPARDDGEACESPVALRPFRPGDAGTARLEVQTLGPRPLNRRHLCRIPFPDGLKRTFAQLAEDPTVYHTMNGPSEFHVIGTLKAWNITPRLGDVPVPVLVISGEHDEATPTVVARWWTRSPTRAGNS